MSKNNNEKAITFISENDFREERTWNELNENTSKILIFLKTERLKKKIELQHTYPTQLKQ